MQDLQITKNRRQLPLYLFLGSLFFILLFKSDNAFAGSDGKAFEEVWKLLTGWIQGYLGRVICGAMILVGVVAGIARQSLMSFAVGIAAGLGLYNLPGIVNGIMTATLPVMNQLETLLISVSNGFN